MREPSLSCGPAPASETYRFTWLRTFHRPVAVRVTRREIAAVVLDGAGGYEPGRPIDTVRRSVRPSEWQRIETAVERAGFWTARAERDLGGCDGAEWIVEGRRAGVHRAVVRWSPEPGPFRDLGLLFLKNAGLEIPADEIY